MEGRSASGQSQYQYQSAQWSRLVRRSTLATSPPSPLPSLTPQSQFPTPINLLPSLLPQQPSDYQAQLVHYNKLISSGRNTRLQSSPLPPLVSAQHIQAVPRPASSGFEAGKGARSARGGHGNKKTYATGKGDRPLMTTDGPSSAMSTKKYNLLNEQTQRPHSQQENSTISQQSCSVPSTPHQHARQFSLGSREPSPSPAPNHSPRSAYSESNSTMPSLRPSQPRSGCKFETAMAHSRRRMPYSIGSDELEKVKPADIKARLTADEEKKLTGDMHNIYNRLLPTPESKSRRKRFVQKLEKLLNDECPGHHIRVHMFGSSGNLLCTDESDVDICITTEWKELEGVCMLAELLAKHGMQKVICVSTAKVPIVKIWDPELRLACDMNINNTLALENTRMVKTYVQIDDRVRPLAMIIKYWAKMRIVNDAAFGGTLSSYTWICMIINFLQTRNPPILPALHQRPHLKLPSKDGHETTFADDLDALRDFGKANKETIGELLFHFFRFYGHEMDYENSVVSVRNGKLISKIEKGWNLATNNRLCVEEPFNTGRNLGNTADDFSFRGLHMELRRAFDLIAEGNFEACCEQYIFPKEEERIWEKPPPQPKPILSRSISQTRGRGGFRSGRHSDRNNRNSNNRRASSGGLDNNSSYGQQGASQGLASQETWAQTQVAQERLHNDLYTTFSVLQQQENNLRLQLYSQSQAFAQATASAYQVQRMQSNGNVTKQQTADRSRGSSFDNPPLTAPIRPDMYFFPVHYQPGPIYGQHSPNTYPSSPSITPAESRRSLHRSTVTGGSGAGVSSSSLRSHSQPAARSVASPLIIQGYTTPNCNANGFVSYPVRQSNGVIIPNFIADENIEPSFETDPPRASESPPDDGTQKEYVGYYLNNGSPPSLPRRESIVPAIPAFGDINQSRRRLSTDQFHQAIFDRLRRTSRSPSPHRVYSTGMNSAIAPQQNSGQRGFPDQSPLVVNGSGSVSAPKCLGRQSSLSDSSLSEDTSNDATSLEMLSHSLMPNGNMLKQRGHSTQESQREHHAVKYDTALVVNGSGTHSYDLKAPVSSSQLNGVAPSKGPGAEEVNGVRMSPPKGNRPSRQLQSGAMSPLDIGPSETFRDDISNLSPVYEIRSPSPTAHRKLEPKLGNARFQKAISQEANPEPKATPKSTLSSGPPKQAGLKPPGHTRASKSEGCGFGTWQKPKTKKKAQAPDQKLGSSGSHSQSEQVPQNDSERKGG